MHTLNPMALSSLLQQTIEEAVARTRVPGTRIVTAVRELSRLFTKERASIDQGYLDDPEYAAGYLSYFLPVNVAKVQVLLHEMCPPEGDGPMSVLDLGSGQGTGSLGSLDWWHHRASQRALRVTAVDRAQAALRQADLLWQRYCELTGSRNAELRTWPGDLERKNTLEQVKNGAPFNLIILANCLNELFVHETDPIAARAGLISTLVPLLAPHGTIMILEPALRETGRALHTVRDRLLEANACTIYSPCLHELPCPALVNPFDWCHEERTWVPPATIQAIDTQVGFIKDALKFSYLLLRKDGKTIIERRREVYRVVSELRTMKGEKRAWLCNEAGRQEVGRQDRLASTQNAAFDQWRRGDLVEIQRIAHKERGGKVSTLGRIDQDAAVAIVRPV